MWYLYLDESGDLGFDFANKRPSNFLTVAILVVEGMKMNRALIDAVKKTIHRKLNPRGKRNRIVKELKGYFTSIAVKKYLYAQLNGIPFDLYCVSIDKRQISGKLVEEKHHVYNYVARLVLDAISFEKAQDRVKLIIDKSKNKWQIQEFNSVVINQLLGRLEPTVSVEIVHSSSNEDWGLQAADVFSWGIFRKYERADYEWFEVFRSRVKYDRCYP